MLTLIGSVEKSAFYLDREVGLFFGRFQEGQRHFVTCLVKLQELAVRDETVATYLNRSYLPYRISLGHIFCMHRGFFRFLNVLATGSVSEKPVLSLLVS